MQLILRRLIDAISFLGWELAFWAHNESESLDNGGSKYRELTEVFLVMTTFWLLI